MPNNFVRNLVYFCDASKATTTKGTWLLKETLTGFPVGSDANFHFQFVTEDATYGLVKVPYTALSSVNGVCYNDTLVYNNTGWTNEKYRYIKVLTEGDTPSALAWLKQNAYFALPQPSTYIGNTSTIVNAGRNVLGYMIGTVVRDDVAKIEMTWKYIDTDEYANLLKMFEVATTQAFAYQMLFFNQGAGDWEERTFYVSDRTSSGVFKCDESGKPLGWSGVKLSLVEV